MVLGLPLFVIFAVYAVVNTYLPVLLSSLGYSVTEIGILQGVFEAAGLAFPIFITSRVSRSGRFSIVITALAGLMIVVLPPLIFVRSFWVTSVSLALFAVGYKGTVPLVDTMVSRSLGKKAIDYGKVRVLGSIGFVVAALLLQFTDVCRLLLA
jgi:PPP family 3-phenylpropionic acid transporter